ncbi:hypothetical protein, partial [Rhodanobacter spathiphylli]|uniref:hypothetical protein n=1 Tax=Rhodanobacter spathiphylli TaxID=347483 RepID=UPI001EE64A74
SFSTATLGLIGKESMRHPYRYAAIAMCLTVAATSAATERGTSQRDYVRQLESAPSEAIVQYCRTNAPEAQGQVDEGYGTYLSSLDKALDMWISSNPELGRSMGSQMSPAAAKSAQASMLEISAAVLSGIKKYDAHKYCAWMATKLKSTTPQSMLKSLQEYEAHAKTVPGARTR